MSLRESNIFLAEARKSEIFLVAFEQLGREEQEEGKGGVGASRAKRQVSFLHAETLT